MKTISLSTNLKQTDMEKQTNKAAVNDIHKQTANSLSDYYTAISVIAGDFQRWYEEQEERGVDFGCEEETFYKAFKEVSDLIGNELLWQLASVRPESGKTEDITI